MKLYYSPGACSLASHIVAVEGGLPLELVKVDIKSHTTEDGGDYYAINRKGSVPALGLDDGGVLTENIALLSFLGDKTGAMPQSGIARYRALEWMAFISSELHKSFTPLFHGATADKEKSEAREHILKRLKLVEDGRGGDYLLDGGFSPPDAYLFVILRWCKSMHIDLSGLPRLTAFKARMESRPGVQKALKEEGL
jgi:glutathione S-transferase